MSLFRVNKPPVLSYTVHNFHHKYGFVERHGYAFGQSLFYAVKAFIYLILITGYLFGNIKVSVKIYYKPAVRISSEKKDGKSSITLRWDKVPGAGKYKVYRYVNGRLKPVAETSKTAVRIGGVKSGKEYTYAVKAYAGGRWTKLNTADLVSIKAR